VLGKLRSATHFLICYLAKSSIVALELELFDLNGNGPSPSLKVLTKRP